MKAQNPAFPISQEVGSLTGLTKREYMATHLMAGIIANANSDGPFEAYASDAVRYADALIAKLTKGASK